MIEGKINKPKLQKLNNLFYVLQAQIMFWVLSLAFSPVYAQEPAKIGDVIKIIQNIIGLLASAAALAFLVMLLFGGFKFVTSGGDQKQVASARSTMTYALIGIILVVVSWIILMVVKSLTGIDLAQVNLPI